MYGNMFYLLLFATVTAVAGRPPAPTNIVIGVYQHNKVRLIWDRVRYGSDPAFLSYELQVESNGQLIPETFTISTPLVTLKSLTPGASYRFHIKTRYDRERSDTAYAQIRLPQASDREISPINLRTVAKEGTPDWTILYWTIPRDARALIKGYSLHYSTHPNVAQWSHMTVPGSAPQAIVKGLDKSREYIFLINVVFKDTKMSPTTSQKFVISAPSAPPVQSTRLSVKQDGTTTVSWTLIPSITIDSLEATKILWSANKDLPESEWSDAWVDPKKTYVVLPKKLQMNRDYYFRIYPQVKGRGLLLHDNQFLLRVAPQQHQDHQIKHEVISPNKLRLSWRVPPRIANDVVETQLMYSYSERDPEQLWQKKRFRPSETTTVLEVESNKTVYIKLKFRTRQSGDVEAQPRQGIRTARRAPTRAERKL